MVNNFFFKSEMIASIRQDNFIFKTWRDSLKTLDYTAIK